MPLSEAEKEKIRKDWQFSAMLLLAYLAIFHFWKIYQNAQNVIIASGVVISLVLVRNLWVAWKRNYFANVWDAVFHGTVILDILLEAFVDDWKYPLLGLAKPGDSAGSHNHYGFYLCALAFVIVVGGYHRFSIAQRGEVTESQALIFSCRKRENPLRCFFFGAFPDGKLLVIC